MTQKQLKKTKGTNDLDNSSFHKFSDEETSEISRLLLQWFQVNQRQLPWRNLGKKSVGEQMWKPMTKSPYPTAMDLSKKAYLIWVSEVMLQQTQVVTVLKYYKKWTEKWPTLEALAEVTNLEDVNQVWSGLGYYSRARRLYEGAKKVVNEYGGNMPQSAKELEQLPGIGRYTACAIASICFNQGVGVLDGNVIRVLTRLRSIGANVNTSAVMNFLWSLADAIVDRNRPGDFNQAMMELGATVCTPKLPACDSCPLQSVCKAYQQANSKQTKVTDHFQNKDVKVQVSDIESCVENCNLCFSEDQSWDASLGVTNYPRSGKKLAVRRQQTAVCVVHRKTEDSCTEFFMVQRPSKGLLANLWEFPSLLLDTDTSEKESAEVLMNTLSTEYNISHKVIKKKQVVGKVVHIFSHIHQTYLVEQLLCPSHVTLSTPTYYQAGKWFSREALGCAAIATAMKKVLKAFENKSTVLSTKRKYLSGSSPSKSSKQVKLTNYFKA